MDYSSLLYDASVENTLNLYMTFSFLFSYILMFSSVIRCRVQVYMEPVGV